MKTLLIIGLSATVIFLISPPSCLPGIAASSPTEIAPAKNESLRQTEHKTEPKKQPVRRALSRQKEAFARVIDSFQQEGENLKVVLEEGKESILSFRTMIREARDQDAEFNNVYGKWEQVAAKTRSLKEQFRNLVEGAAEFYAAAEEHAETIQDENLRTESLGYIEQSRNSYLARLKETEEAIQQVDAMKTAVDDTMKALEIRFAVDVVDQRIAEMFEQIDLMVEDVLNALKKLEIESQQVLGQFQ